MGTSNLEDVLRLFKLVDGKMTEDCRVAALLVGMADYLFNSLRVKEVA